MPGLSRREGPDPQVFLTYDERVQHEELRYSLRSPSYSALLSAMLMGSGQIYNGQERRGLLLLSDEIYDRITYDGAEHVPAATVWVPRVSSPPATLRTSPSSSPSVTPPALENVVRSVIVPPSSGGTW